MYTQRVFKTTVDEDIPSSPRSSSSPHEESPLKVETSTKKTYLGPMTRSRAKQIQQEVNSLLAAPNDNINENFILPNSRVLLVLRFTTRSQTCCPDHQTTHEQLQNSSPTLLQHCT
ncbi:hypothetical protein BRADI_3g27822v3 [Brachypodium distachyon]|uniref:Uncharacterized protein n=1 Tax=Brachypodium distachyon TaxID=15368 RepID=A0A0Q3FCE9_BRADI|nr:hypothetical protein BRADI_3g27822v3 [Brachypodium distachyon]